MIAVGVDGGSSPTKVVLLECDGCRVVASGVRDQGADHDRQRA